MASAAAAAASSNATQSLTLLIIFIFSLASIADLLCLAHADESGARASSPMRPVPAAWGMKSVLIDEAKRRRLNSFRVCALCTCCGGPRGLCLPSPCCYTISCNIPNRPFGFCSFIPKTCNCFGCHL